MRTTLTWRYALKFHWVGTISTLVAQLISIAATEPSPPDNPRPFAHYGASFLADTVQSLRMEANSMIQPRDELKRYLEDGPEHVDDIVGWWGVCAYSYDAISDLQSYAASGTPIPNSEAHGLRLSQHPRLGYTIRESIFKRGYY